MGNLNLLQSKIDKVNKMQSVLEEGLRRSVSQAIEIGKVLIEIQDDCKHGEWKKLFIDKIKIPLTTADRYMLVAKYVVKNPKLGFLTNLIEAETYAKKIAKEERDKDKEAQIKRIIEYKNTGVLPEGWKKTDYYAYNKYYSETNRDKRIKKVFESQEKKKEDLDLNLEPKGNIDAILEELKRNFEKYDDLKRGVSGNEDVIVIIEKRLELLLDNNRRLEFCNTLIKFLREKAIAYNKL